jgi:hypothetical protein
VQCREIKHGSSGNCLSVHHRQQIYPLRLQGSLCRITCAPLTKLLSVTASCPAEAVGLSVLLHGIHGPLALHKRRVTEFRSPCHSSGGPGLMPVYEMLDLWWTQWYWGRFSPSTSVSPANFRSSRMLHTPHLELSQWTLSYPTHPTNLNIKGKRTREMRWGGGVD